MPAEKRKTVSINLLPGEQADDSATSKVIKWLLSTFRIIVVLVQIVVIASFVTRVFIDARLSNLNREIEEKYALASSYKSIEDTFKIKRLKLETFASLKSTENAYAMLVNAVAQEIPSDVQLINIQKNGNQLSIKARTTNENSIYTLANRLNSIEAIEGAQVVEMRQDDTTLILTEFVIQANVPTLSTDIS